MSFLCQCVFYFLHFVIKFFCNDILTLDITDSIKFFLAGISLLLMIAGFICVFKIKVKKAIYLDIPLFFLVRAIDIVWDICASKLSFPLPSLIALIPVTILTVRQVKWLVDVVKKRRKPQKRNAVILVAYIVSGGLLFSLAFIDFSSEKQEPTAQEIKVLDDCYAYTRKFSGCLPTDKDELKKIEDITEKATDDGAFIRAYDKSEFYKDGEGGIFRGVKKLRNINRQNAYAEVVALRLKTLIALKDYDGYNSFFVENCGYLFAKDSEYYFDLWSNENYVLSETDFDVIISGFESALELCDNDLDRLFLIGDIIKFYNQFEPDNAEVEKYESFRSEIYANNDLKELFEVSRSNSGYVSEKLAIED